MLHATIFGIGVVLASLITGIVRARLKAAPSDPNHLRCPGFVGWIPIGIGALFASRAIWGLIAERDLHWLIILLPGAAAIILFLPVLLFSDVVVADHQIAGPGKVLGPFTWYRRNRINLSDVRAVRSAPFEYTYVESVDGSRVYIGNSYPGAASLIARLRADGPSAEDNSLHQRVR